MFKKLKIGIKILLILSFIAIVSVGIIGYLSYQAGKSTLEEAAYSKLRAVREIKKNQILDYFKTMEHQLCVIKDDNFVNRDLQDFNSVLVRSQDNVLTQEWIRIASRYNKRMKKILDHFGYHDIFLINLKGDIVYTVLRESDLGMNIPNSELHKTSLGKAFEMAQSLTGDEISIADFLPYFPSAEIPAAFMMAPMQNINGEVKGYFAFQIAIDKINYIMQEREGLGKTGETYLVGPDMRMRSDSFLDKERHSVKASFAGSVDKNGVDTEASRKAISGLTGGEVINDYRGISVLSAYTFLEIG